MKLRGLKVRNFRSIYELSLDNIQDFHIFIGRNNVGKTSLLTAIRVVFENLDEKISKSLDLTSLNQEEQKQIKKLWFFSNYDEPCEIVTKVKFDEGEVNPKLLRLSGLGKIEEAELRINIKLEDNNVVWELIDLDIGGYVSPIITRKVEEIHNIVTRRNLIARPPKHNVVKSRNISNQQLFSEVIRVLKNKVHYIVPYACSDVPRKRPIQGIVGHLALSPYMAKCLQEALNQPQFRAKLRKYLEKVKIEVEPYIEGQHLTKQYEWESFRIEMFGSGDQVLDGLFASLLKCSSGSIIMIEEPEVHLHPDYVRKLARALQQFVREENVQILAVVQSPEFIGAIENWDAVDLVRRDYVESPLGSRPATSLSKLAKDRATADFLRFELGLMPDIFYTEVAILVEGNTDVMLFGHYIQMLREKRLFRNLDSYYWKLLTCAELRLGTQIKTLLDFGVKTFLIADNDEEGKRKAKEAERWGLKRDENIFLSDWPDILCALDKKELTRAISEIVQNECDMSVFDESVRLRINELFKLIEKEGQ
jgi:predicted ATP-dependent endonuclease of OLD family